MPTDFRIRNLAVSESATVNSDLQSYGDLLLGDAGGSPFFEAAYNAGNSYIYAYAFDTIDLTANNIFINSTDITAPIQTVETDDSVTTRLLAQKESLFSLSLIRPLLAFTANQNAGGTATVNAFTTAENGGYNVIGTTTASAWQRIGIARSFIANTADSAANSNAAIPVAFSTTFFPIMTNTATWQYRFVVGDSGTSTTPPPYGSNAISGRGFGALMYYSSTNSRFELNLFAHNGTNYVTGSGYNINFTSGQFDRLANLIISSDGAGTIKAFWGMSSNNSTPVRASTTPVLTITGGPTNGNYIGQYFSFLNINSSSPPASANRIRGLNSMIHVGTAY